MFRNHRFDSWLLHCSKKLQYIYRSLQAGCRLSYMFGEFLYLKVRTGTSFIIRIINTRTNSVIGTVEDGGRVCQCG